MTDIRTQLLSPETKIEICRAAHNPEIDILELVPEALTPEEIDSLGMQVANLTETIRPSRSAYLNGRKTETDVVRALGFAAAVSGDAVTARSASTHLARNKLSVFNWVARGLIWSQLRGHKKEPNPLQTS